VALFLTLHIIWLVRAIGAIFATAHLPLPTAGFQPRRFLEAGPIFGGISRITLLILLNCRMRDSELKKKYLILAQRRIYTKLHDRAAQV
jgi:hypothetical protein